MGRIKALYRCIKITFCTNAVKCDIINAAYTDDMEIWMHETC